MPEPTAEPPFPFDQWLYATLFSNSFRRVLGVPPSVVRSGRFETSTILQA
ncbi:MAG: hypothetical protein ACRDWG_10325 [Actinomycetes bacterium]